MQLNTGLRSLPQQTGETEEQRLAKKAQAMGLTYAPRAGGGLTVNDPTVAKSVKEIASGNVDADTVKIWQKRNPRIAGIYGKAYESFQKNQQAKQRLQEITSRNIYGGNAEPFQQQGPVRPGETLPVIPAQGPSFNLPQATQMAAQEGVLTPEAQQSFGATAEAFQQPGQQVRGKAVTLQEMEYLNSLPARERRDALSMMLTLKRAGRLTDIAGTPTVVNPDNTLTPLSTYQKEVSAEVGKEKAVTEAVEKTKFKVKSDADFVENYPKLQTKRALIEDRVLNVDESIDNAISKVGNWTTGIPGSVSGLIPGTEAYDLNQELTTIKANLGFDRLDQMREASPTGGALGQVAVQELEALQSSIKSLDRKQTKESLRKNLIAVKKQYRKWKAANERAKKEEAARYNRLTGGKNKSKPAQSGPPKGISPEDWKYMTPQERALFQ